MLARILEDSTFSMLNSAIYFNEVDIVNEIAGDHEFLKELFAIFDDEDAEGEVKLDKGKGKETIGPQLPSTIGPQLPSSATLTNGSSTTPSSSAVAAADDMTPVVSPSSDRKHDAILFLQSFALMAKNLQLPLRAAFFRSLADRGLLRVIEMALTRDITREDPQMRGAVIAILMSLVDHDSNNVRGYSLKRKNEGEAGKEGAGDKDKAEAAGTGTGTGPGSGGSKPLMEFLIELFIGEEDLGLKAQMSEALRVLVDAGGEGGPLEVSLGPGAQSATIRLTFSSSSTRHHQGCDRRIQKPRSFCSTSTTIAPVFSSSLYSRYPTERQAVGLPHAQYRSPRGSSLVFVCFTDPPLSLNATDIALFTHLCDLLCFFISHHSFRSKYFVLSSHVGTHVAKLFATKHKHLKLAALRFFRATLGKTDDFFNRDLIKKDLFRPILDVVWEEREKDNLLASAGLEFFEFVRTVRLSRSSVTEHPRSFLTSQSNAKNVINHLLERYSDRVRQLATTLPTFKSLIAKWEQNNEPPPATSTKDSSSSSISTNGATSKYVFLYATDRFDADCLRRSDPWSARLQAGHEWKSSRRTATSMGRTTRTRICPARSLSPINPPLPPHPSQPLARAQRPLHSLLTPLAILASAKLPLPTTTVLLPLLRPLQRQVSRQHPLPLHHPPIAVSDSGWKRPNLRRSWAAARVA